jgi:diguanylate cyclase (GGDEF)-like protein/PAS domain S-box-containing protein
MPLSQLAIDDLIVLAGAALAAAIPVGVAVYLAYRLHQRGLNALREQEESTRKYERTVGERTRALMESEERFRRAFDHAPIGIALVSPTGRWLKTNRALSKILGYSPDEFRSGTFHPMMVEEDLGDTLLKLSEVMEGRKEGYQCEKRYIHKDGSTVWTSWSVSADAANSENAKNLIFQIQDITEKKHAEQRLQHEATHDALTGLPNRAHFMKRLDEAMRKRRANPKYMVSVLFIDLDRFKYVNDSLGHFIGDELLVAIAQRLNASMRPPDMVARLGGDEFVVLVEGRYYSEKMTRIAERIQRKISSPFKLRGHEVFTTASIGILKVSEEHLSSEDVIRDADTAMYHAKRSGKARHEQFHEGMRNAVRATLLLETDLRKAIQNEEIELYYQPIFSLTDDSIHSLEALARWHHADNGVISPERFIPLAEEIGLIDALGEQLLARACREVQAMRERIGGDPDFKLSVNLSSCQFVRTDLVDMVATTLEETGFPAERLKLEITETVFFEHHDRAIEMLNHLRSLGITTDVDDFGTGYSNLGYLVRLPISTLKIDRSFVTMMDESPANREVIRTIIALAGNLGLKVIAEGIETEHQRDELRSLGCDYGQGYYFARPMGADQIEKFVIESGCVPISLVSTGDVPEIAAVQ